jgi:hypothetical protein
MRRASRAVAAGVLLAVAPAATGCYSFVPVGAAEPRPEVGHQVRAYLNQPDRVRLQHVTAENVVQVNGELVEWDNGRLLLSAFWVKSASGFEYNALGETVSLRDNDLERVEAKTINIPVTVGVTAVAVAGAILLGAAFGTFGSSGDDGGQPPPQTDRRSGIN